MMQVSVEDIQQNLLVYLQQVEAGEGGRLHVQLRDGPEIEVSRRQARLFRARMTVA